MARVGDPLFLARLTELLQTRDPINLPLEIGSGPLAISIAIPADMLLAKARRRSFQGAEILSKGLANPAAGTDWNFVVPSDRLWIPRLIIARLQTSATVINRFVRLRFRDPDSNELGFSHMRESDSVGHDQAANLNEYYNWLPGVGNSVVDGTLSMNRDGLPYPVPLPPTYQVGVQTVNLQAGDQWTIIRMLVEEFAY